MTLPKYRLTNNLDIVQTSEIPCRIHNALSVINNNKSNEGCPSVLQYPLYHHSKDCIDHNLYVLPMYYYSDLNVKPSKPVLEFGILFYIYSDDHCQSTNRYMNQVEFNIDAIHEMDRNSNIALATNCDVSLSIAQKLNVLIPIHDGDLIIGQRQWYTRMLYNAYTPFNYTFILDTHVFPCYNTSYSEIFRLFKESNVDISISNRKNEPADSCMGAAVLSKWGPRSFDFWTRVVQYMKKRKHYEDQSSERTVLRKQDTYTFKQLSCNWFFASHGITEDGVFVGSSRCYRSSVVVTGPVRWIHGHPNQCALMNGKNNEFTHSYRAYFTCGTCNCNKKKQLLATSKEELESFVGNYSLPTLLWEHDTKRHPDSLFWYQ